MLQAERNKEAREAKHAVIEQKREEAVRLEAEHAHGRSGSRRAAEPAGCTMRQKRETLQQEAAQADSGAGRPGRAAARRGSGLPAHRPAACRSRAARAGDRAAARGGRGGARTAHHGKRGTGAARAGADRAEGGSAGAGRSDRRAGAGAAAAAGDDGDAAEDQRVRRSTSCAKIAAAVPARQRSCGQTWSTSKQAAWPKSMSRLPCCAPMQEIVRIADEMLAVEEETCRTLRQKHRADGPGEHDGAGGVQGDGGAAQLPRDAAQGPDGVDREHAGRRSRRSTRFRARSSTRRSRGSTRTSARCSRGSSTAGRRSCG